MHILLNDKSGSFRPGGTYPIGDTITNIFVTQLDTNNTQDLLLNVKNNGAINSKVFLGQGNGQFTLNGNVLAGVPGEVVIVENLDTNKAAEVIIQANHQLFIYKNHGNASFNEVYNIPTDADDVFVGNFIGGSQKDIFLNFEVFANPFQIGSVMIELVGPISEFQIVNEIPYTLFGVDGGFYNGVNLIPGSYTLTATGIRL